MFVQESNLETTIRSTGVFVQKMKLLTRDDFFNQIGEADEKLKSELYERLTKIEEAFANNKIAASKTDKSFDRSSIGGFLEGITLNVPDLEIRNKEGQTIGSVSYPNDLKNFVQSFCQGSTHTAYKILSRITSALRRSKNTHLQNLLEDIQPKKFFINIIDLRYKKYIGNNPKYINREPIKATKDLLSHSIIKVYQNASKTEIIEKVIQYMQKTYFNNEPRPIGSRSFHPLVDGYCQVCHRPNIKQKKYCRFHQYNPDSRNSSGKTELRWAKQAFRNLGLLLHDEGLLAIKHPNSYIQIAEKERMADAQKIGGQKRVQSEINSEYCRRLEGWAKHHPVYLKFARRLSDILDANNESSHRTEWNSEISINLISEVIKLCKDTSFIPPEIFPKDFKSLPIEDIKPALLGPSGLDIEKALHPRITILEWTTMLCRYYQLKLAFSCRKVEVANQLKYQSQPSKGLNNQPKPASFSGAEISK